MTDFVLELGCGLFTSITSTTWGDNWYVMDTSSLVTNKLVDEGTVPESNIVSGFFPIDSPDDKRYDNIIIHDIFQDMNHELIELTFREIRDILNHNGIIYIDTDIFEHHAEINDVIKKHFIQTQDRAVSFLKRVFGINEKTFVQFKKK